MIIECPKCQHKTEFPSKQQIEAYRNVYIHGLSHKQAAKEMGVTRSAVSYALLKLKEKRPDLFETDDLPTLNNTRTSNFDTIEESEIIRKW